MSFDADPPNVRYRQLAQQCLDLLASISNPETRAALRERARTWTRLAGEYETRIARDTASELQPSAQQQRQVQPEEDDK
jgi:muramidase (phage lysozyme)